MSFGSGTSNTSTSSAQLSPEQRQYLSAQTGLFTGTQIPMYQQTLSGARDVYNQVAPGALAAAQGATGIAQQAQETLGGTGESALRTGISGLESLFSPNYQSQMMQAALAPGQAQYQQNLAALGAGFGGAGQIGSARQALANTQLAGSTQAQQQMTMAKVLNDIQQQRMQAAGQLAQYGQQGIQGAMGAAGQQVGYAMAPQDVYNKYASVIYGMPQSTPSFAGTQSTTQTQGQQMNVGDMLLRAGTGKAMDYIFS